MTSVPKPLKFLRPHYGKLKEIYEAMAAGENKVCNIVWPEKVLDVISSLAFISPSAAKANVDCKCIKFI